MARRNKQQEEKTMRVLKRLRELVQTEKVKEYLFFLGLDKQDKFELRKLWEEYYNQVYQTESKKVFDEMRGLLKDYQSRKVTYIEMKSKMASIRLRNRELIENPEVIQEPSRYDPDFLRNCTEVREYLRLAEYIQTTGEGFGEIAGAYFQK